ncbi:MAG: imidazoleglycerol-phosphate dehydratase HisB [Alphaproteobacteria bacterium]
MRKASIKRETLETKIQVAVSLDGQGKRDIQTGIGFFDHMLDQLSRHSLIDMNIHTQGDLHIDMHHSVEDTGIALGQAIKQALGDKKGITRYATEFVPMDECLARAALDISGRPYLVFNATFNRPKIGEFDTELVKEFFVAFAQHAGLTLHIEALYGENNHHIAEAIFKAVARALRKAVEIDPRNAGNIPSTKGILEA